MRTEHPLVSIVIVNWNGADIIHECLVSVKKIRYEPVEIIVVDNASTDDSVKKIKCFENIILVESKQNLGYAGGNNLGFTHCSGRYIATLNNDTEVDPDWLEEPIKMLESYSGIGIISCRQMNALERGNIDTLYSYLDRDLLFTRMGHGQEYIDSLLFSTGGDVLAANGASAIYRKQLVDQLGGFEEKFFAYHEESDLHMRAFYAGWRCSYVPASIVYHRGSYSFEKIKPIFYYYLERNRIWFLYRHFPWSLIIKNLHTILIRELRIFGFLAIKNNMLKVYLKARIHGFAGISQFKTTRREALKKYSEKHILLQRFLKEKKIVV